MSRLSTPFSRALGLRLPLVQAPMAGGPSSPALVAAASSAGALGSFGFAYTQPEDMKKACAEVRTATGGPFGINLFLSPQPANVSATDQQAAIVALAPWYREMSLPVPSPAAAPYVPDFDAQLDAVAEIRPAVSLRILPICQSSV